MAGIPRGIEVLVKKASVDPAFKELLLTKRAEAAVVIGLTLEPAELLMLASVPAEQLDAIIARTKVADQHRRVFLGTAAAAMLAALGGVALSGCGSGKETTLGERPDRPPVAGGARPPSPVTPERQQPTDGIRPDRPPPKAEAKGE